MINGAPERAGWGTLNIEPSSSQQVAQEPILFGVEPDLLEMAPPASLRATHGSRKHNRDLSGLDEDLKYKLPVVRGEIQGVAGPSTQA